MDLDTAVTGGTVVIPSLGVLRANIGIRGGRVVALSDADTLRANQVIDASGLLVMPGAIDAHVHLFNKTFEEEIGTETRSAAVGGVTTMLIYLLHRASYQDLRDNFRAVGNARALIDYGFHYVIVSRQQLHEMRDYAANDGVTSFKYFMTSRGEESDRLGLTPVDNGFLYEFLEECKRLRVLPCMHCEDIEVAWTLRDRLQNNARDDLAAWTETRPGFVEAGGVLQMLNFAAALKLERVYIVHLSSAAGLDAVSRWGDTSTIVETCVHYLVKTCDSGVGAVGKVNPPLRYLLDIEALWAGVAANRFAVIATDHVARLTEAKKGGVWRASPGFPGMATMLPLILTEGVDRRGIPIEHMVRLVTEGPARIFGLYPRKGTLLPGSDADLVLIDARRAQRVEAKRLESRASYTPFEGDEARYWPVLTMVRGRVVMRDGAIVGSLPWGEYVPRVV